MEIFGKRLRELRTENKLTQKQLSDRLGVSGNTVYAWETDKQEPSMELLVRLSEIFNVSLDYLFGRSDF